MIKKSRNYCSIGKNIQRVVVSTIERILRILIRDFNTRKVMQILYLYNRFCDRRVTGPVR